MHFLPQISDFLHDSPFGIWFGKSNRAYGMAEPVLNLM
jgi:ABC-type proline/glycine betaine transport system permease subunit